MTPRAIGLAILGVILAFVALALALMLGPGLSGPR